MSKLAILMATLVGLAVCQTDQQKGSYGWSAALRGNILLVDFDVSSKSTDDKVAITEYRAGTSSLTSSDSSIKIALTSRKISNEHKKGRMSFSVTPLSGTDVNVQGMRATLKITQPTRRLLADDQSPSPNFYSSKVSPKPSNVFERRLLGAFSDSDTNDKDIEIKTQYIDFTQNGALNVLMIYHLFTVVYWFVTIYLILINPFFEYARKSVRIFWIGQYAFYFQNHVSK